ncbi:MAG: restriction endonuclease, partial [Nitrosopumilus sp.]
MEKTVYDLSILDNTTGREFEIFLVNLFEKLGYSTTVTNRSKDYGCDMMLQRGDYRIAVQAKRSESELNFTSVQRVLGSLKKYNAQMSIVVTNNKFISSAKQLAKIKDVVLIDRKKLLDLIELSNLSVNHKKDLIQFSNKTRKEIIKQEIDKETFNFLGLDV